MALKYFFFIVLNIRAMEAAKDELLRNPALDRQYSCQEHNQTSVPNLLVQTNLLCLMQITQLALVQATLHHTVPRPDDHRV